MPLHPKLPVSYRDYGNSTVEVEVMRNGTGTLPHNADSSGCVPTLTDLSHWKIAYEAHPYISMYTLTFQIYKCL